MMERDSLRYLCRRRLQQVAYNVVPHEWLNKIYAYALTKKCVNLRNPHTFNEKIQWMKLHYYPENKLIINCTDKYMVRKYIEEKGYGYLLTPLLGTWLDETKIEWNDLPDKFVIKCNHGCAYNIVCDNKKEFDISRASVKLNKWLHEDFGKFNLEKHYSKIEVRRIIAEEYLGKDILDYKFFCFAGEPLFLYVSSNLIDDRRAKMGFFYVDGTKMPLRRDEYKEITKMDKPCYYEKMLEVAKKLAQDFRFVRADFFATEKTFFFAELTFTPGAGFMRIEPDYFDEMWGAEINISDLLRQ